MDTENFKISERQIGGCGIAGIINQSGKKFSSKDIIRMISSMRERANGLGGGFAGYGIYPEFKDCYCFHIMYKDRSSMNETENYLKDSYKIERDRL